MPVGGGTVGISAQAQAPEGILPPPRGAQPSPGSRGVGVVPRSVSGQVWTDPDAGKLQGSWEDQPSALDISTARDRKVIKAGSS